MIKNVSLSLLILIGLNSKSQTIPYANSPFVIPSVEWIQYYGQASTVENHASALDASNSVFITGYSTPSGTTNAGIVTLKYDSLGVLQFAANYNNPGFDEGRAIVINNSGNAFITGVCTGTANTGLDAITIKYAANGTQLWASTFDGMIGGADEASDIKIDNNGDVYIIGKSYDAGGFFSILVVKYDGATGNELWHITKNANNLNDEGISLNISKNNQYVIVTGNTTDPNNGSDIILFQLSATNGNLGWTQIINGSANGNDFATTAIISGNSIVVCGKISNGSSDYLTAKFDINTGAQVFKVFYDYASTQDYATSLVRDSSGNIAVTGVVLANSVFKYNTVMYDSTGSQLWVNIENTALTNLAVNPKIVCDTIAHHFYISGEILQTTKDIFVYQITPNGNTSWKKTFDGQNNDIDAATGIVTNGAGEVFLSALSKNLSFNYDMTTIKISQTPAYYPLDYNSETNLRPYGYLENKGQLFDSNNQAVTDVKLYTETGSSLFYLKDFGYSIVHQHLDTAKINKIDSLARIDVTFSESNPNASLFPFDPYSDPTNYFQSKIPNGVTNVMAFKRIIVPNIYPYIDLHYYSNQNGVKYYFVIKPGGNPNSIQQAINGATAIQITGTGGLEISSALGKTTFDKSDAFQLALVNNSLVTVSLTWQPTWSQVNSTNYKFNIGTYNSALPLIIQVDQGNASLNIATGNNPTWSTYYGKSASDRGYSCDADNNGRMYATGSTANSLFPVTATVLATNHGSNETFLLKFTKYGEPLWRTIYGGNGPDFGYVVKADDAHNCVYFAGMAGDPNYLGSTKTDFPLYQLNGATNKTPVSGAGQRDYGFIGKINMNTGLPIWITLFGEDVSPAYTVIKALDMDINGNLFIGGIVQSNGSFPIVSPNTGCTVFSQNYTGVSTGFISKFNTNNLLVWSSTFGSSNGGQIEDIQTNSVGEIFITGTCPGNSSNNFPLAQEFTNDVMNNYSGGSGDAFIAKFHSCLQLKWSTLYGGSDEDQGLGIELRETYIPDGVPAILTSVYVCGFTKSTNFPFVSNLNGGSINDNSLGGSTDGFLAKFNGYHQSLWSSYVGDSNNETLNKMEFSSSGVLYIIGESSSPSFLNNPVSGIYSQTSLGGGLTTNNRDVTIIALNSIATENVMWATFYGGKSAIGFPGSEDYSYGIAVSNNVVYICGYTYSQQNFPLFADLTNHPTAYLQSIIGSGQDIYNDAFLATIEVTGTILRLEEIGESLEEFDLYPNPSNGQIILKVKKSNSDKNFVEIYDIQGRKVHESYVPSIANIPFLLNLQNLNNGMYIVKITSDGLSSSKKIIINK